MVTTAELDSLTSLRIVVSLLLAPFGLNPENTIDFNMALALFLFPLLVFFLTIGLVLILKTLFFTVLGLKVGFLSFVHLENPPWIGWVHWFQFQLSHFLIHLLVSL